MTPLGDNIRRMLDAANVIDVSGPNLLASTRHELEIALQTLCGGAAPEFGNTIIRGLDGWNFRNPSSIGGSFGLNVRADPYNAVGDGITDDTASIQAAIDDATANGGGIVFFPCGTYLVSQLVLESNVWLWGESWCATIKAKAFNHTTVLSGTSTGSNAARTLNDTGAAFPLNGYKNFTVHITGGTGSGQKRTIQYNSLTTRTNITDDWTTIPDATSTYEVLDVNHLIVFGTPATTRNVAIWNLQFQGNKANQTAILDCFYLNNQGWADANLDSMHLLYNVLVDDFSGSGLTRSAAVREMRILASRFNRCNEYGSRNLLDETQSGASDCKFAEVVCAKNGLSGFSCGAGHDLLVDCKSFGNGTRNVSGNAAGYLLFIDGVHLAACEAQENFQNGYQLLLAAKSCSLSACNADANGGAGVVLDATTDTFIEVAVQSTSGLLYTTAYALKYSGGATRNTVIVQAQESQLGSGLIDPTSSFDFNSTVLLNNVWYGPVNTRFGVLDVANNMHFGWGKLDAGAATNPFYTIITTDDLNPRTLIQSSIGATVRDYITLDHVNNRLRLGMTAGGAPFGEIVIDAPFVYSGAGGTQLGDATHRWGQSFFGAEMSNLFGATNVDRTHFQWGRASSPAGGNPSYYLKTNADATPSATIESFDGTNTRRFAQIDFANSLLSLGSTGLGNIELDLVSITSAATNIWLQSAVAGDSVNRFNVDHNGKITWGPGSGAIDSTLERISANHIQFTGTGVISRKGTDGSTTDDHFIMGKTSSPASGNPEWRLRTGNQAEARLQLQSNDGSTVRTFLDMDPSNGVISIGTGTAEITMSGATRFPSSTSDPVIEGVAGSNPALIVYTTSGTVRWSAGYTAEAEGGGDAGGFYGISAFNDAGSFSFRGFQIARTGSNPVSLYVGGSLKNVTEGAADSGTAGFKYLKVPN